MVRTRVTACSLSTRAMAAFTAGANAMGSLEAAGKNSGYYRTYCPESYCVFSSLHGHIEGPPRNY